ncbi:transmembrane protein 104 homolog [Corticium candelabrum]|uniref:transmembrane protein 104 homolog n=1 Tax=Corticium candelabrum TaxID=121492 RepID=UPI002E25C888|nr:transmembrane protein 104 homolog [Corticium candelabrum]
MARAQAIETRALRNSEVVDCQVGEIRTDRRFELPELCQIFLGRVTSICYLLALLFYLFLSQWMASPIIGTAVATNMPINSGVFRQCNEKDFGPHLHPTDGCWNTYALSVLLFSVVIIPLSCLELKELAVIQVIMALFRFIMLLVMSIYSIVSVAEEDDSSDTSSDDDVFTKFNIQGLLAAVPVFVFAQMLQSSIPSLTQPISNKRRLVVFYSAVFLVTTILYSMVGVTVAMYKKNNILEVCSANWKSLTSPEHGAAVRALSYFIVLFPAIDIWSAYPLTVIIMANMVENMYNNDPMQTPSRATRVVHRFFWATMPIVASVFITNLVILDKYDGLIAYFIVFWFPALLQYKSRKVCEELCLSTDTPYSSWYSGNKVVLVVFLFGIVVTLATFVGFVLPGSLS